MLEPVLEDDNLNDFEFFSHVMSVRNAGQKIETVKEDPLKSFIDALTAAIFIMKKRAV